MENQYLVYVCKKNFLYTSSNAVGTLSVHISEREKKVINVNMCNGNEWNKRVLLYYIEYQKI